MFSAQTCYGQTLGVPFAELTKRSFIDYLLSCVLYHFILLLHSFKIGQKSPWIYKLLHFIKIISLFNLK